MDYQGPAPDETWQATLDTITPPGGRLSWLRLVWVPGDPWEPVHRWVIYQMLPIDRANDFVRADLRGPSPRERGRFDKILGTFQPDPNCNIDLLQWDLYRATGCYGRPYWIVQGSQGGHKRTFNRVESTVSRMNGGPAQPALIGDLPYATPDRRTFDKLAKLDLARSYSFLLSRVQARPEALEEHDEMIVEQMRERVWTWLESQVQDVVRDNRAAARAIQETADTTTPFDEQRIEQRVR